MSFDLDQHASMAEVKLSLEDEQRTELLFDDSTVQIGGSIEENKNEPSSKSEAQSKGSWISLLTLNYYQEFFDVTTAQVMERVFAGMCPYPWRLVDTLHPSADLYGPFWLSTTLIMSIAISGNLAHLFQDSARWEFHFQEVTVLGSVVYAYTWLLPVFIWALLWWRGNRLRYTLLQLLAIYGYSIGIFIPITVLWIIDSEAVRWTLLAVGTALSGSVLATSLWKPLTTESNKKLATCVLVAVILMHTGLSIGFKFYYFNAVAPSPSTTTELPPVITTVLTVNSLRMANATL